MSFSPIPTAHPIGSVVDREFAGANHDDFFANRLHCQKRFNRPEGVLAKPDLKFRGSS
jgi:hypothetical protein